MFERHERTPEHDEMRGRGHHHRGRHHAMRGHRGPNGPHPHGLERGMRHGALERGETQARPEVGENTCPMCDMRCSLDEPCCGRGAALAAERRAPRA